MILVALGVGFGETYLWPRLVIVFGPDIRWLFTVGVVVQTVVMLEMARYAMATGESIFFGAARIARPTDVVLLRDRDPGLHLAGHISGGAEALEEITGIPWQLSATRGPAGHRRHVHRRDVHLQPDRGAAGLPRRRARDRLGHRRRGRRQPGRPRRHAPRHGRVHVGHPVRGAHGGVLPDRRRRARLRGPVRHAADVVHAVAARQGRRHGRAHPEACAACCTPDEEETIPDAGDMFDTDDPEEMRKWKGWRQVGRLRRHPAVLRHHDAGHDHLHGHGHERGRAQPRGARRAARRGPGRGAAGDGLARSRRPRASSTPCSSSSSRSSAGRPASACSTPSPAGSPT